ncbi:hypothetical protein Q8F55_004047 [Vanrija albida]|uniref:Uncharacterized protein n=1 Tax=Vanrija albida TaxID=181172 RepID=A0ABR3Q5W9_9TREE
MKTTATVVTVLAAATAVSALPAPTPVAGNPGAQERAEAAGAHDVFDAEPTPAPTAGEHDKRYYRAGSALQSGTKLSDKEAKPPMNPVSQKTNAHIEPEPLAVD